MGDGRESLARLKRRLEGVREALRTTELIRGMLLLCAFVTGAVVAAALADNILWLPGWLRGLVLFALVGGAVFCLVRHVVRPLSGFGSDDSVAHAAERRYRDADNLLINAVQLSREKHEGLARKMVEQVVEEAAEFADARVEPQKVPEKKGLKTLKIAAVVCVAALALYVVLAPGYFKNAFTRYVRFTAHVAPLTGTRLSVRPGNVRVTCGDPLEITAEVTGRTPAQAKVRINDAAPIAMEFDGRLFRYRIPSVTEPFTYSVAAGDASTQRYRVGVLYLPTVERLDAQIDYPVYTGLPEETIEEVAGATLDVLGGCRVTLTVRSRQKLSSARLRMKGRKSSGEIAGKCATWSFRVPRVENGEAEAVPYTIELADFEGNSTRHDYTLRALPDDPPTVEAVSPGRDITVTLGEARQQVLLVWRARDDFALHRLRVEITSPDGRTTVKDFPQEIGTKSNTVSFPLVIEPEGLRDGATFTYRFLAHDNYPGREPAATRRFAVRVLSARSQKRLAAQRLRHLMEAVRRILERQMEIATRTERQAARPVQRKLSELSEAQEALRKRTQEAATMFEPQSSWEQRVISVLESVASGPMSEARVSLQKAAAAESPTRHIEAAAAAQRRAVEALRRLLSDIPRMLAELRKADEVKPPESVTLRQKTEMVKELKEKLEEFVAEQNDAVKASKQLAEKGVENWAEGDEKVLEELQETEAKWEKYFEDLKQDLSRLPEQDFSDSSIARELIEIESQVKLAEDALTRRTVEMAVPHEQAGAEKAEELVENLERWLSDVHDYLKWNMEDIPEQDEIPLADLPEELEDIVGELVDQEDSLEEEVEDVSSGWADSLDEGAGWTAMDGPISNMSARGITGNLLPNRNEIGGRSGEGRMGRSHGQFVEEEATGKGGRQTPTRLTPDPYEAGAVRDSSPQSPGGATGGGKLSGGGLEGLRGPVPPAVKQDLGRLAQKQREIAQKAEKLSLNMKRRGVDTSALKTAARHMRAAGDCLRNADLNRFRKEKEAAVERLLVQKEVVGAAVRAQKERLSRISRELREEIMSARSEKMVDEYRELLKAYYRNLADAASEPRRPKKK